MTEHVFTEGPVLLTIDQGIARLKLNRPNASNGMDVPLLRQLHEAILACHGHPNVRVVVLGGEGPNFCAGGDVKTFAAKGEQLPDYLREATAWLQLAAAALLQLRSPVIAAVHGFAAGGGGFGLVCASDLVVATRSAKFLAGATRVGMVGDAGTSATLPRLVGLRRAMEIVLTNPTITADEAAEMGLVTRVVDDEQFDAAVDELAQEIARGAPLALGEAKRLLWAGSAANVHEQLPEEARVVSELSGTADAREGLAAVIERRTPSFHGH